MIETPQILDTEPQQIAYIRLNVPSVEIRNVMGPGIQELWAVVRAQSIMVTGPWFTYHFRRPTDTFDFQICLPVAEEVTASGRVQPGYLPGATVARTVYQGPYEGLIAAWAEFHSWIEAQGRTPRADLWERYLVGPESNPDPSSWRTELNRPLSAD